MNKKLGCIFVAVLFIAVVMVVRSTNDQHFKPRTSVTNDGVWKVTISNVRTDNCDGQKPGQVCLIIDVSMTNISGVEQSFWGYPDWDLNDAHGQDYAPTDDESVLTNPPSGTVEPAGLAKGSLIYAVPAQQKNFTLVYKSNVGLDTPWNISVP